MTSDQVSTDSRPAPAARSRAQSPASAVLFSWQSADRLIDAVRALRADLSLPDVQRRIAAAARTLVDAGEAAFVPAWSASRAVGDGVAGTATRIDVPVVAHDRMHGVLRLRARTAATFGPADQALLAVFAAAAGSAIAVTGLLHEARRCERSGYVLLDVANALLAGDEPDTVLPLIAAHAAGIVAADTVAIALPGWPATGLRIVTAVGHGADELTGMQLPRAGTIVGDVLRDGATALIEDGCLDERMFRPAATAMTAGPVLVVPLRSGPEIAGVLLASRRAGKPRPPRPRVPSLIRSPRRLAACLNTPGNSGSGASWRSRRTRRGSPAGCMIR